MSKPWFTREGWQAKPGLHALIVGISAYPHLPKSKADLKAAHYGMVQLASPALTAYRLATLLTGLQDRFDPPLATCRLLLAPSQQEIDVEPALADFTTPANYDNFSEFAKAWRSDACASPEGMTFFYQAGHGIQRDKNDHVLLLQDFSNGKGATFSNKGVNLLRLTDGMAASEGQETIAVKQLYFFDACRVTLNPFDDPDVGNFWDYKPLVQKDLRLRTSFFAALPGGEGYAKEGGETLFGSALIRCLEGGASVPSVRSDPESPYVITVNSLNDGLTNAIAALNEKEGGDQSRQALLPDNFVVLSLEKPPQVKVLLTVDPDAAAGVAKVGVVELDDNSVTNLEGFDRNPYEFTTPAGVLILRATTDPPRAGWSSPVTKKFVVLPPVEPCSFPLSRK